jgi:hypothetical protein
MTVTCLQVIIIATINTKNIWSVDDTSEDMLTSLA